MSESFVDAGRVHHHEAGHAVVALALGMPVYSVSVTQSSEAGVASVGSRKHRRRRRDGMVRAPLAIDLTEIGRLMAVDFAGYLAERRHVPERRYIATEGASHDFAHVARWDPFASEFGGAEHRRSYLATIFESPDRGWRHVVLESLRVSRALVAAAWPAIDELAWRLADVEEVTDGRTLAGFARRHRLTEIGGDVEAACWERDARLRARGYGPARRLIVLADGSMLKATA